MRNPPVKLLDRVRQRMRLNGYSVMTREEIIKLVGVKKMGSSLPLTLINTVLYFSYLSFNFPIIFFKPRNSS